MGRKKQPLPTYPVGTPVHVKWGAADLDCAGVVVREPRGQSDRWLVDVGDAVADGEPIAVCSDFIVGTLPADDSIEAITAWLHPSH